MEKNKAKGDGRTRRVIWIKSSFTRPMRFVIDIPTKHRKSKILRRHGRDAPRFFACPSLTTGCHSVVLNARKFYKSGVFISC